MRGFQLFLLILLIDVVGCSNDQMSSSQIVIPPGGLIQLDLTRANIIGESKYTLELMEYKEGLRSTGINIDAKPKPNFFRRILPKTFTPQGPLVAKIVMDSRTTPWFALIFPEQITYPDDKSTLIYNLLSHYPGRDLSTYTFEEVQEIEQWIENFKNERMTLFGLNDTYNPDHLYVFIRNGLSSSVEFLQFLEKFDIRFDYDADGDITNEPYPFGRFNRPPVVDPYSSTPQVPQSVRELEKKEFKALAIDPDGDQVFYSWLLEGQRHLDSEMGKSWWTPDYNHSRANPYIMSVLVTDGGKITRLDWNLNVINVNRRPVFTYNCASSVQEFQEWTCTVQYSDPDGESVDATLAEWNGTSSVYLNGQAIPHTVNAANTVSIRWTPNNQDALAGSVTFRLQLLDSSNGLTLVSIPVQVGDVNSPPVAQNYTPSAPVFWEFDQCAQRWGPEPGEGPNEFTIEFIDPNNLQTPVANPPDNITIIRSGSLNSQVEEVNSVDIPGGVRKTYRWTPLSTLLTGTFEIMLRDDHGGISEKYTYNLTAQNINQSPCITNAATVFTSEAITTTTASPTSNTMQITDDDTAAYELFGFQNELMLKFVKSCASDTIFNGLNAGNPVIYRRAVYDHDYFFRVRNNTCIRLLNKANAHLNSLAGYIRVVRSAPAASAINITTGHAFILATPHRGTYTFHPVFNTTIRKEDLEVLLPVVLTEADRNIPAGTAWTLSASLGDPSIVVTNPQPMLDPSSEQITQGFLRLTRTNTTNAITIPQGFKFYTNATSVHEFESPDSFTWAIGSNVIEIPVWRNIERFGGGLAVTTTAPLTGFTMTSVDGIANSHDDQLIPGHSFQWSLSMNVRPVDAYTAPVGTITNLIDSPPMGATGLSVTNTASLWFDGEVRFTRTSATSAVTLPQGFTVGNDSGTHYSLGAPVTFAIGETTKTGWVRKSSPLGRIKNAPGLPLSSSITYRWQSTNTALSQRSSTVMTVYEGVPHTGALIEFNHRDSAPNPYTPVSTYWYPDDRMARVSWPTLPDTGGAAGDFRLCREPGTWSQTCTSCAVARSGLTNTNTNNNNLLAAAVSSLFAMPYFNGARCYLRYNPNPQDLSKSFTIAGAARKHPLFRLEMRDPETGDFLSNDTRHNNNTASLPMNYTLTLNYVENNHPPVLADGSFTPLPTGVGLSETNPLTLGGFEEGIPSEYQIYATDSNRGTELKVLGFELDSQVYDLSDGAWKPRPSGLEVALANTELFDVGSRVTGVVRWNPTDEDSKRFAGGAGFVIRVKVFDSVNSPVGRQQVWAYYRLHLANKNQVPFVEPLAPSNTFTVLADTYWSYEFDVYDRDAYSTPTFSTQITLCRSGVGAPLLHPSLDAPNTDPYECHASAPYWAEDITVYDAGYEMNMGESRCRAGSSLNNDLAVPKLSRVGIVESVPVSSGSNELIRRQRYKIEWCPQRGHIGEHTSQFFINDNGDEDTVGTLLPRSTNSAPINFKVLAPVYLISPRNNINGDPEHFMPQTSTYAAYPFRYVTLVKNSRGNPLEYTLLQKPGTCGSGGMCISAEGVITWSPTTADITASGEPGHLVRLQVRDTVTNETDTASFYLVVQNALSPIEQSPTIQSYLPGLSSVKIAEKESQVFSVSATDPNPNDQLFYRWLVNGKLAFDEGPSFTYRPSDMDGSLDPDGNGPLGPGDKIITVEVTDGNQVVSHSWNVKVKNNIILGNLIFDITTARPQSSPSQVPTELDWRMDVGISNRSGNVWVDNLIFGGSYFANYVKRHFLWNLRVQDGVVQSGGVANPPWNFDEKVPWGSGKLERLAVSSNSGVVSIMATSAANRSGPYGNLTDALNFGNIDISNISWAVSHRCQNNCINALYTSPQSSDDRITTNYESVAVFFASDDRTEIYWDPVNYVASSLFYDFGDDVKVSGMKVNANLHRLYVTTQQISPSIQHRLWIFDIYPTLSGGSPTYIGSGTIFDGVPGHEDARPTDVVVDLLTNRVFTYLSGTGGVATFVDSAGVTNPSFTFIGVDLIGRSAFDIPGQGRRMLIRAGQRVLVGSARDSSQIYTIDLDSFAVKINAIVDPVDNIVDPGSEHLYLINRSKGRIYLAR